MSWASGGLEVSAKCSQKRRGQQMGSHRQRRCEDTGRESCALTSRGMQGATVSEERPGPRAPEGP